MIKNHQKMKKRSVTEEEEESEEAPRKKKKVTFNDSPPKRQVQTGPDVGIVQTLNLRNFMCHNKLEFNFNPGTNIIHGANGSGKSALLTALVVGLGGKAVDTSRGKSLKTFIKTDKPYAMVSVKLRNQGEDAYKPQQYGDSIIIERRVTSAGHTQTQLKSATGTVVSTKREELGYILEQFNIQVDNPIAVLNQDTSRNFLHSTNPKNKYQFFLKATKLEKIKHDYWLANHERKKSADTIREKRAIIPTLQHKCDELKRKYEQMESVRTAKERIQKLQRKLAWSLVHLRAKEVEAAAEEYTACSRQTPKFKEKVDICKNKYDEIDADRKKTEERLKERSAEAEKLSPIHAQLKETRKEVKDRQRSVLHEKHRLDSDLKNSRRDMATIQERIAKLQKQLSKTDLERERQDRKEKIQRHREVISELEAKYKKLNEESQEAFMQEMNECQKQLQTITLDVDARRRDIHKLQTTISHQEASRTDRMRQYGDRIPTLLQRINNHTRFKHKPRGPVGAYVTLKDPRWARAVERCLGGNLLRSFCVDNMHDFHELRKIIDSVCNQQGQRKPDIISSKFLSQLHDVASSRPHCRHPTLLEMVDVSDTVIANCLIDQRSIESVLLIENTNEARTIMSSDKPPAKAREAFTINGDQLFCRPTYRYYSINNHFRSTLLTTNIEDNIRAQRQLVAKGQSEVKALERERESIKKRLLQYDNSEKERQHKIRYNQTLRDKYQHELREILSIEDPEPAEIRGLDEEESNLAKQTMEFESAREKTNIELRESTNELQNVEQQLKEVAEKLKNLASQQEPIQNALTFIADKLQQAKNGRKHYEHKLREHLERVTYLKVKQEDIEEKLQEDRKKASYICPEVRTEATPDQIEGEITQLEKIIQQQEKLNGGQLREITQRYQEGVNRLERIKKDINSHSKFLKELDKGMGVRQAKFEEFRRTMSTRADLYFRMISMQRNYMGSLSFDHDNEILDIRIQPGIKAIKDRRKMRDLRQLSGGEKSFATVCFLLSLWESMELPFRWLDEFDVYMDLVHRQYAFELMLDVARKEGRGCQFVFLTPLDIGTLSPSHEVHVFKLEDPRRPGAKALPPANHKGKAEDSEDDD